MDDLLDNNGNVDRMAALTFVDQSVQKLINLVQSDFDTDRYGAFSMKEKVRMITLSGKHWPLVRNKPKEVLENYMNTYLKQCMLREAQDRVLIATMNEVWRKHCLVNYWVKRFFYLNVKAREPEDDPINKGHSLFYRNIFRTYHNSLAEEFCRQLVLHRNGNNVDLSELKVCSEIFKTMDTAVEDAGNAYRYLEATVIDRIREHARSLADTWNDQDTVSDYLMKSQEFVESECSRISGCLDEHTQENIRKTLEMVLVEEKKDSILTKDSGLTYILENDKRDDLKRLYFLFQRVNKVGEISPAVEKVITNAGQRIVEKREQVQEDRLEDTNVDVEYISQLLNLWDKWSNQVQVEFRGNTVLQNSVEKAFETIINWSPKIPHDNAELLAKYSDQVLKGAFYLNETDRERELDRIDNMARFLFEKDMFEDTYRNLLAKRLLTGKSDSRDAEVSMISKLKSRYGAKYTFRLEAIRGDSLAWETETEKFKTWRDQEFEKGETGAFGNIPKIDFNVRVLTQGCWPNFVQVGVKLPNLLETCKRAFEQYYYNFSQNKKLTWQNSEGIVFLKGYFIDQQSQASRSYKIKVKTLQAAFLLLLDAVGDRNVDFVELKRRCQISTSDHSEDDITKRILHSLSSSGIVEKNPPGQTIRTDDTFKVNPHFTSRRREFTIPMAFLENVRDPQRVESDRRKAIDAAIVRIMKTRQTMTHQDLIADVSAQLQFFSPDVTTVRRRIEHCINEQYMERDSNDHATYHYVA